MCGICGLIHVDPNAAVDRSALASMSGAMVHRGPDDEGIVTLPGAGLAARRLSIIDVDGGHQPIGNEDRSIWVALNGEIYNYRELRDELTARGHRFRTCADTEVLVHLYEERGDDLVNRLNGTFAFALWDSRLRHLLLARDRCGIKPLYYAQTDGCFAFASELRALLTWPELKPRLDRNALAQYLLYEYVPTPLTILEGVRKLPPGSTLTLSDGSASVQQYWDIHLEASESGPAPSESEAIEGLKRTLRDAVQMEMVSDVPLGVFLSGGIDSSAVTLAMVSLSPQVESFSIGFENRSFDESEHARTVARHLGTRHHEMIFTSRELLDLAPRVPELADEPLGDSSLLPTHLLSRFAREHVKVALGGDGGDELLAGYSTLQAHRLANYYLRLPRALRRYLIEPTVRRLPVSTSNLSFDFKAKRFTEWAHLLPEERHHRWLGSFAPEELPGVLGEGVEGWSDPLEPVRRHLSCSNARDPLNQLLHLDMKLYLEGDILPKVDRASMAASLEVRVPLLNQLVVDYLVSLPLDMKLRGFTRKWLLRKAMRGLLPERILNRPKKGFNIPVANWLKTELRELMLDTLLSQQLQQAGWFNTDTVRSLISDHMAGRADNRKRLWTLLVFSLWADRYLLHRGSAVRDEIPASAPEASPVAIHRE